MNVHWRKSTNERMKAGTEIRCDFRFRDNLQNLYVSPKKQALYLFFSLTRLAKNMKVICACTESTDLILLGLQNNMHLETLALLFCNYIKQNLRVYSSYSWIHHNQLRSHAGTETKPVLIITWN